MERRGQEMKSFAEKVTGKPATRVCLVLAGEFAPGGMLDYLLAWIKELRSENTEVLVLVAPILCNSEELLSQKETLGFRVLQLPYPTKGLRGTYVRLFLEKLSFISRRRFRQVERDLDQFSPDLVHIVDDSIFYPFISRSLRISSLSGLVITVHDPKYHDGQFRSLFALFAARMARWFVAKEQPVVHVHSNLLVGEQFRSKFRNIISHQHPVPVVHSMRSRTVFHHDVVRFGFFGRIEKYKGIGNLIPAIQEFERSYAGNYELSIVGRGDLEGIDFGVLNGEVSVINDFVSTDRFHSLIANIDILLLPYNEATQSGVALLGAAYKLGIVAFDVGAVGEFVKDYALGRIATPGDINAFSSSMLDLVERMKQGIEV